MLRRVTEHDDPELLRVLPLQPRLEERPRTGAGLPSLRVGRHPNNDVVLTSTGIPLLLSRQHALITYDGEQFTLVDLDTTNGTYVRALRRPCGKDARLARAWHRRGARGHQTLPRRALGAPASLAAALRSRCSLPRRAGAGAGARGAWRARNARRVQWAHWF